MAQETPETTYVPEEEEKRRKERERRAVQEGTDLWRRQKEELQRQKQQEQREVCVVNGFKLVRVPFASLSFVDHPSLPFISYNLRYRCS